MHELDTHISAIKLEQAMKPSSRVDHETLNGRVRGLARCETQACSRVSCSLAEVKSETVSINAASLYMTSGLHSVNLGESVAFGVTSNFDDIAQYT